MPGTGKKYVKKCVVCNEEKLYEAFDYNSTTDRYDLRCKTCKSAEMREQRAMKREGLSKLQLAKMVNDLHRQLDPQLKNLPALSDLCGEIMTCFGDAAAFCRGWYNSIMAAEVGSNAQLKAFKDVANLVAMANEVERSSKDVEDMSEKELRKELDILFSQYMQQQNFYDSPTDMLEGTKSEPA